MTVAVSETVYVFTCLINLFTCFLISRHSKGRSPNLPLRIKNKIKNVVAIVAITGGGGGGGGARSDFIGMARTAECCERGGGLALAMYLLELDTEDSLSEPVWPSGKALGW